MTYSPTTWADGVTPVNAANLNKIEAALAAASAGGATDLSYKGDWVAGTYKDGDIVVYNGILYMCTKPGITTAPGVFPPPGAQDAIPKSLVDAAGDLLVGSANDVVTRLPKGADGTVLGMAAGAVGWLAMGALGGWQRIADIPIVGATATIDLTSIPATYKHLRLELVARTDTATGYLQMRVNNDSGTNYRSDGPMWGGGSFSALAAQMSPAATNQFCVSTTPGEVAGLMECSFLDYAQATYKKHVIGKAVAYYSATQVAAGVFHGDWNNTAAINRVTLFLTAGNFTEGRMTLYGIG